MAVKFDTVTINASGVAQPLSTYSVVDAQLVAYKYNAGDIYISQNSTATYSGGQVLSATEPLTLSRADLSKIYIVGFKGDKVNIVAEL